jgi:hypothetical protein
MILKVSRSTVTLFLYHENPIFRPVLFHARLAVCLNDHLRYLSSVSFDITESYVITRE